MDSDQELIELVNEGDTDAFEALYYRYRDWVYHLAWRFTGNQQDALDVLQETFTYLLGKCYSAKYSATKHEFPGFRLTASMTTFLYPVVKHLSLTLRSKNRRFTSDEEILRELPAPASRETHRCRSDLAVVLTVLPDEQREVLLDELPSRYCKVFG